MYTKPVETPKGIIANYINFFRVSLTLIRGSPTAASEHSTRSFYSSRVNIAVSWSCRSI